MAPPTSLACLSWLKAMDLVRGEREQARKWRRDRVEGRGSEENGGRGAEKSGMNKERVGRKKEKRLP